MRRFLGLCVAALVLAAGGAAFAVETDSVVVKPDEGAYKGALPGAVGTVVEGLDEAQDGLNSIGAGAALQEVLDTAEDNKHLVEVALVYFTLPASGKVTYAWADNEYLFNFIKSKFEKSNGTSAISGKALSVEAKAAKSFEFTGDTDYEYSIGDGRTAFVSVKDLGEKKGGGSGGGCSSLTLGAAALFLLPVLAVKRGKK